MNETIIENLSNAFGASGFESDAIDVALQYIPKLYSAEQDNYGNVYIQRTQKITNAQKTKVLIIAQIDEAGLIVSDVLENGMIKFECLGRWSPSALSAMKVLVKNSDGNFITGVIAAHSSHLEEKKNTLGIDEMHIDIGASSRDDVCQQHKISFNCPIVPYISFEQRNDVIISKALSYRMGCSALLELLNSADNENYSVELCGLLACRVETKMNFSSELLSKIKPNIIIHLNSTPVISEIEEQIDANVFIKKGPVLQRLYNGVLASPNFCDFVLDKAREFQTPLQINFNSSSEISNCNDLMLRLSVPFITLSCPVRCYYGHNNIASMLDYNGLISIVNMLLKSLDSEGISTFMKND